MFCVGSASNPTYYLSATQLYWLDLEPVPRQQPQQVNAMCLLNVSLCVQIYIFATLHIPSCTIFESSNLYYILCPVWMFKMLFYRYDNWFLFIPYTLHHLLRSYLVLFVACSFSASMTMSSANTWNSNVIRNLLT